MKRLLRAFRFLVPGLIVFVFLVMQTTLAWTGGLVRRGGDSEGYLRNAAALLRGDLPPGKGTSYLGYDAAIALCQASGLGLRGLILIQMATAALAAIAQYDLGRRLHGHGAGLLAAGLLVANPDISRWHVFILTDSLYTSMVILAIWATHLAATQQRARWFAGAAIVVASTALLRPNGWILVPIATVYWTFHRVDSPSFRWLSAAVVASTFALCAVTVPAFRGGIQAERPGEMLRKGEVIWGYPAARLSMPGSREPIAAGWTGELGYILRHPLACTRLACLRVWTEFAHVRPFYSPRHNSIIVVCVAAVYVLAAIGYFMVRSQPLARLIAAVIGGQALVIALTFADWDGRFLLYVFPGICLFSACGVAGLLGWARTAGPGHLSGEQP